MALSLCMAAEWFREALVYRSRQAGQGAIEPMR
jgi:hypothetical protein